jgi:hypothetical protein
MTIILSLAQVDGTIWAVGPDGLFRVEGRTLTPHPQPQEQPGCCAAAGGRLLVGGAPNGVAYEGTQGWQAAWMDGISARVVCLAPDPRVAQTGAVLAGTLGGGLLRSENRGETWAACNFGLREVEVYCLAWAAPQPAGVWPPREVVFAGTDAAIYRSPNGGRGWKCSAEVGAPVLCCAASADFHADGVALVGTEEAGLWRSVDGGFTFARVPGAPETVNALAALPGGWLLSDLDGLWRSADGLAWEKIAGSRPALAFLVTDDGILAGGEAGVEWVQVGSG